MRGFILLVPLFLIRYGLLRLRNREALKRAAFFPPMIGNERIAFWVYQLSTVSIVIALCFLRIKTGSPWFFAGLAVYGAGATLFAIATVSFAAPSQGGVNRNGLYRLSRNPMYVSYFVYFLGCVLLTQSVMLLVALLIFQASSHWIIRSEERWCQQVFAQEYAAYAKRVRRYI